MKKKWFLSIGILAFLVLAALIYTRPMPLEALCEADITQCQSVFGYHFRAPQAEDTRFEFPADDVRGQQLTALFAQQKFAARSPIFCRRAARPTAHRTVTSSGRSASASTRPISLTAAPARACLSPAGTFLASCRFSALTMARPSAAPCRIRTRFCSRSMTSFPLNRDPFHTLSQQEESL